MPSQVLVKSVPLHTGHVFPSTRARHFMQALSDIEDHFLSLPSFPLRLPKPSWRMVRAILLFGTESNNHTVATFALTASPFLIVFLDSRPTNVWVFLS